MSIYHDYHSDSRSSSISSWDQIQISLKSLLPSYEPILFSTTVTPTEASDCSGFPEITKQIDEEVKFVPYGGVTGWIEGDQQSESVMKIENCLRSGQNGRVAIGAEDDTDAKLP
ncbi:hypothetical protein PIB30_034151 [Stylosanthes scabra]|uniref:Uncharacterized protein n=1 Tax=Stylosanthes scabra TaxID=79078 RepID=A0ABU6WCW2_9FABA|nr:hypothetical protein [Stylosanthes scabra]